MGDREIPVFCYWNGRIKDGPDGPYYEGSTLRVIRVKRKTKLSKLLDELYRTTGFDRQSLRIDLVGRFPSVVQPSMVKYIRLPVVDDSSLETMLEVPTFHPSINNVELYLEVKQACEEAVPVACSPPLVNNRRETAENGTSAGRRRTRQCSRQEEASCGIDLSVTQQPVEPDRDNMVGVELANNGLFEDDGSDDGNHGIGGDTDDDDMGDEGADLHGLPDLVASLTGEKAQTQENMNARGLERVSNAGLRKNFNPSGSKPSPLSGSWLDDRELRKGMLFKDRDELKKAVKLYSIRRQREFLVQETRKDMCKLKCKRQSESKCRWRLRAARMKKHGLFEITRYTGPHTCNPAEPARNHRNLDLKFLADETECLIRAQPSVSVAELNNWVKEKFGLAVSYAKMYKAKQKVIAKIFGDWDKNFRVLPKFMAALHASNGTLVDWQFDPLPDPNTASFRRLFWAFSQSIEGFPYCRPLITVDSIDLTGKYVGKMMIATGVDANNQLFPLAFAIAEEESSDSWRWFLTLIREKVTQRKGLCLISSPHPDVLAVVNEPGSQWQEPWAYHRFCLKHLCTQFDDVFHNKLLKEFVYKAGTAHHPGKFDAYMSDIEKVKPEASRWLNAIPMERWTLVHDGGRRYGLMTTNLLEMCDTLLNGARDLPITICVHLTFDRLRSLFDVRRGLASESLNQGDMYTEHVIAKLQEFIIVAKTYDVTPLDQSRGTFEVVTPYKDEQMLVGGKKRVVQLSEGVCTCGKWQVYKFPCSHVLAVCEKLNINRWQYIDDCYSTTQYSQAYAAAFAALPEESDWPAPSEIPRLFPHPSSRRSGGRPATARLRNEWIEFKAPYNHSGQRKIVGPDGCLTNLNYTESN